MADITATPTPAAAQAATPVDPKATETKNPQQQATSQVPSANSAGGKSTPASRAIDEVMNTLPGTGKEEGDDIEDDGSDLNEVELKKAEAKLRKKLKVGGKEIEVDEDELVKRAQMGYSAEEKWQEAAKMRKQIETFVQMLQNDPAQALEKMGFDVDALAEARIQQRIEEMKKSPEQLAHEKVQRELEQLRAEREREREELRSRETKALQDKYAVDLENEINSAFDSTDSGLPKSPYIVKRMADVMIYALKNKIPDFTAKKALEIVQSEVLNELNQMYSAAPDEVFEKLVGKQRLDKYRRSRVKRTKPAPSINDVKPTGQAELNKMMEDKPKEKIRAKDFFKQLGKK